MIAIGRSVIAIARTVVVACCLFLAACGSDGPPPGFDAVAPAGAQPGAETCPDLRGTFDLSRSALGGEIARAKPPQTHGLPVLLTFADGPSHIEGWWVVPREKLVAFAQDMSTDSPKRYARWLDLVLLDPLPESMRYNIEGYQADIAKLGPPGPVYAQVVPQGCRDRWQLVSSVSDRRADADGTLRSVERETWLARDAAGALLIKRVTYHLTNFTLWASATQKFRTSHETSYERIEAAASESAAPLTAAELPIDPAKQPRALMTCAELPERVAAFSQRLTALLPPKTQLIRFDLNPVRQQDSEGHCPFAVVDIAIAGGDALRRSRTVTWLRAEPNVESVEIRPVSRGLDRGSVEQFRVVLR